MQMTLRWFGDKFDSVKLWQIRQIPGVTGVITTLYDIPAGDVWPLERIEALQKEIGRRAYEDWEKNGSISLSNIGEQLMEISKKKETIAQQKIAAEELEKKEQQILGTADNQKPSKIFCPNCGQSYDGPVKFCRKCGTKLQ